jgi:hypothetical protein
MTNIARLGGGGGSLKMIILMTNETLKLVQSKIVYGLIIPMYILNIFMDPLI